MALEEKRSLNLLQLLRAVAALMVVLFHGSKLAVERLGSTQQAWGSGAAGVDIFFLISGFVMMLSSRSLIGRSRPALVFVKRRLQRIVPLYWIYTTLKLGLVLALPGETSQPIRSLWYVVASYLFLPALNSIRAALPILIVGWTLNFEMLFYLLFALALAWRMRLLVFLTPALVLLSAGALFLVHPVPGVLNWCNPIVLEFLFGAIIYRLWERRPLLPLWVGWLLTLVGFGVLFRTSFELEVFARPWTWGLAAAAILAGALVLEPRFGRKVPKLVHELGDASYSIYLTHPFVMQGLGLVLHRQPFAVLRGMPAVMILALIVCSAVGLLSYRLIERPIIRYFQQRRERSAALVAA